MLIRRIITVAILLCMSLYAGDNMEKMWHHPFSNACNAGDKESDRLVRVKTDNAAGDQKKRRPLWVEQEEVGEAMFHTCTWSLEEREPIGKTECKACRHRNDWVLEKMKEGRSALGHLMSHKDVAMQVGPLVMIIKGDNVDIASAERLAQELRLVLMIASAVELPLRSRSELIVEGTDLSNISIDQTISAASEMPIDTFEQRPRRERRPISKEKPFRHQSRKSINWWNGSKGR